MIIAIDGVPGTGKTTLATDLARELAARGETIALWLETDKDHPLHPIPTDALGAAWADIHLQITPEDFVDQTLTNWQKLIDESHDKTVIVESFPFQSTMRVLLQMNAGRALIDDYWTRWQDLAKENVKIIYLRVEDAAALFHRMCETRGDQWREYICEAMAGFPIAKAMGLAAVEAPATILDLYNHEMERLLSTAHIPVLLIPGVTPDYEGRRQRALGWVS